MKISELISLLEMAKHEHGDLYVFDYTEEKSISEVMVVLSRLYELSGGKLEKIKSVILQ